MSQVGIHVPGLFYAVRRCAALGMLLTHTNEDFNLKSEHVSS